MFLPEGAKLFHHLLQPALIREFQIVFLQNVSKGWVAIRNYPPFIILCKGDIDH